MTEAAALEGFLAVAEVAPDEFALGPDYELLLLAVEGTVPGPSFETCGALAAGVEAVDARAAAQPRRRLAAIGDRSGLRGRS